VSPFGRLHPSVQHLIAEVLRFPELRAVQAQTIDPVLDGRDAVVLAPTAGGKTEAALFPVLSRVLSERLAAVAVLWICPLRALLNNVEPRLIRMTEAVGLRVGKWHGDVPSGVRKGIVEDPPEVLMITPESLEVLLISPADHGRALLGHVRIAVVDEVHAFAGDPRGAHLLSLLARLELRGEGRIQRIGLSATVGNPEDLALWLAGAQSDLAPAVVAPVGERKAPIFQFRVAQGPRAAAQRIRDLGAAQKKLVFVESRSRAEDLARLLHDCGIVSHVHHSSVGRAARDEAEAVFENARDATLVATSSLELGIDIGDLDHIFQMDAPATVASLAQRIGRTGRRAGSRPRLTFIAEAPDDLLLGMALASLHREGWVEDLRPSNRAWLVAVHQIFARLLERGGATRGGLVEGLGKVPSFAGITRPEWDSVLDHMVEDGWVEVLDGAMVLGRRAEKTFGARNFFRLYAVFDAPESVVVRHGNAEVGTLQRWFAMQLVGAQRLFRLAGRSWEAVEVDLAHGVVRAEPAGRGQIPTWSGRPGAFGRKVCERILAILQARDVPDGADDTAAHWLEKAREAAAPAERGVVVEADRTVWHTYAGGRINAVLARLLEHRGGYTTSFSNLSVKVRATRPEVRDDALRVVEALAEWDLPPFDDWARFDATARGCVISSFQQCLPDEVEQEVLRAAFLDVEGARVWADEVGGV
jgi:ATP-dependent Lhr-like helicase